MIKSYEHMSYYSVVFFIELSLLEHFDYLRNEEIDKF